MRLLHYCFLICLICEINEISAQNTNAISYTQKNSLYSQNFDGLPAAGSFTLSGKGVHFLQNTPILASNVMGWQFYQIGGSSTNASFAISTGSGTGQNVYSLGSSGSTERALGTLASGTGTYAIGIIFTNNTGFTLNSLHITFIAEQWRKGGSTNKNNWTCKYKTGVFDHINQNNLTELPALNFYSISTTAGSSMINGNLVANQLNIDQTIDIADWKPGEQLLLRWDDADETGSDDIMAIDQFNFLADYKIPNPTTVNAIEPLSNSLTNADTIKYAIQLGGNIVGLSSYNFAIRTNGLTNAAITKIEGSGDAYTASVFTGKGTGLLLLGIVNDSNLIPGISNLPFYSVDSQWVDKDAPILLNLSSPNNATLKAGDTLKLSLTFNEPVQLLEQSPSNYLPITIGNTARNCVYTNGNNSNELNFQYIIQSGELDKDGIQIDSVLAKKNLLIGDMIANSTNLVLNSISIQPIQVDAVAPTFFYANDTIIGVCSNNTNFSLNNHLTVVNKEIGELLTWKLITPPTQIAITSTIYQQSSTDSAFQPTAFFFSNNQVFVGKDSCVFMISDGINETIKKIYFDIHHFSSTNIIQSNQDICANSTILPIIGSEILQEDSSATYLWEMSTMSDTTGFNSAIGKNQLKDYPETSISNTSWFRRKIIKGACTNSSNTILIKVWNSGLWNGHANSNWNNTNNWCGSKIPNDSSEILIPSNTLNSPIINEYAACKKITLQKNAGLTITGTLSLSDQLVADSGSINAQSGTLILNGISPQLLNSTLFKQQSIGTIRVDNTSGVTLVNQLYILQQINMAKGILETNDQLYLKNKATVGASAMGSEIKGIVQVENTWGNTLNSSLLAGHPFNQPIFSNQLQNKVTAYYHDFLNSTDSFSIHNNWKLIESDSANLANQWKKYQGVQLILNDTSLSGLTIFRGKLNTGLQEISLAKNKSNGFNIVANPFLSPINLMSITKSRMTGNYYWIWNPKQGIKGGYTAMAYDQSYVLNPFEAFIAEARDEQENSLLIPEESKVLNYNATGIEPYKEENGYFVEMSIYNNQQFWDRLVLTEKLGSKNALDSLDAIKLLNPDVNFYSASLDQKKLAIDARKLDNNTVIPIFIEAPNNEKIILKINQAFLPSDNTLVLHDRFTNLYCTLVKDSIYSFEFTADPLSSATDRFEISRLIPKGNTNQLFNYLTIKIFPNPAIKELAVGIKSNTEGNCMVHIYTLSGTLVKSISLGKVLSGTIKLPITDLNSGTYLLQVICGEVQKSIQFIKQ